MREKRENKLLCHFTSQMLQTSGQVGGKQAFSQMGVQPSWGQPLSKKNCFIFQILLYNLFLWEVPTAYFGCPLFKPWLKFWLKAWWQGKTMRKKMLYKKTEIKYPKLSTMGVSHGKMMGTFLCFVFYLFVLVFSFCYKKKQDLFILNLTNLSLGQDVVLT